MSIFRDFLFYVLLIIIAASSCGVTECVDSKKHHTYSCKLNNSHKCNKIKRKQSPVIRECILGKRDATVKATLYTSYTCKHCADFHINIFDIFKKKYLDSGLVRLKIKNFIDDKGAFEASMLTNCIYCRKHRMKFMQKIFQNQQQWMKSKYPHEFLIQIFEKENIGNQKIANCLSNKKIAKWLLNGQKKAVKQGIYILPALEINGKIYQGMSSFEKISKILDPIIQGNSKN